MKRYLRFFAIVGALALVLAACGDDSSEETTTTVGTTEATEAAGGEETTTTAAAEEETTTTAEMMIGEGREIGVAWDVGGRGDQSFNDLAALAWDEGKRMFGYTGR